MFSCDFVIIFFFLFKRKTPYVMRISDWSSDVCSSDLASGGILDIFNTFSGGSLERMSLIALGVMPYITASIVVQLASSLSPTLAAIKKEGESGRKKLNQYNRYGTVGLTAVQGYFIAVGMEGYGVQSGLQAVVEPGMLFRVAAVVSLIGGTMFLLWLGEQITSRDRKRVVEGKGVCVSVDFGGRRR